MIQMSPTDESLFLQFNILQNIEGKMTMNFPIIIFD
jgi:hypothetical protein